MCPVEAMMAQSHLVLRLRYGQAAFTLRNGNPDTKINATVEALWNV